MRLFKIIILATCIIVSSIAPQKSFAQAGGDGDLAMQESLNDLFTVMGIGFGGAILGLSTLSFVEEPKDHLKNILVGASLGIIIGVGIVAYRQATKSREMYLENAKVTPDFKTNDRLQWHAESFAKNISVKEFPQFSYSFTF